MHPAFQGQSLRIARHQPDALLLLPNRERKNCQRIGEFSEACGHRPGYGWLAISLALQTEAAVYAVDFDEARLRAAKKIAAVFGVHDRIEWAVGTVEHLPFADRSIDIVFCVEVLEHVDDRSEVVQELGRISKDTVVITTPNKASPLILHDTCLPFCHWLPPKFRNGYATLFGRRRHQHNNRFWTPWGVCGSLPEFECKTPIVQMVKPNLSMTFRRVAV
jgi:SAM-dependent methyltransferase